jgi:hypothetical protein
MYSLFTGLYMSDDDENAFSIKNLLTAVPVAGIVSAAIRFKILRLRSSVAVYPVLLGPIISPFALQALLAASVMAAI